MPGSRNLPSLLVGRLCSTSSSLHVCTAHIRAWLYGAHVRLLAKRGGGRCTHICRDSAAALLEQTPRRVSAKATPAFSSDGALFTTPSPICFPRSRRPRAPRCPSPQPRYLTLPSPDIVACRGALRPLLTALRLSPALAISQTACAHPTPTLAHAQHSAAASPAAPPPQRLFRAVVLVCEGPIPAAPVYTQHAVADPGHVAAIATAHGSCP